MFYKIDRLVFPLNRSCAARLCFPCIILFSLKDIRKGMHKWHDHRYLLKYPIQCQLEIDHSDLPGEECTIVDNNDEEEDFPRINSSESDAVPNYRDGKHFMRYCQQTTILSTIFQKTRSLMQMGVHLTGTKTIVGLARIYVAIIKVKRLCLKQLAVKIDMGAWSRSTLILITVYIDFELVGKSSHCNTS